MYPWLAYSPKENGAYCKACVHFGNVHLSIDSKSSKLHRLAWRLYNYGLELLQGLKNMTTLSEVHKTALVKASEFLKH